MLNYCLVKLNLADVVVVLVTAFVVAVSLIEVEFNATRFVFMIDSMNSNAIEVEVAKRIVMDTSNDLICGIVCSVSIRNSYPSFNRFFQIRWFTQLR